jgi:hypothetical protein
MDPKTLEHSLRSCNPLNLVVSTETLDVANTLAVSLRSVIDKGWVRAVTRYGIRDMRRYLKGETLTPTRMRDHMKELLAKDVLDEIWDEIGDAIDESPMGVPGKPPFDQTEVHKLVSTALHAEGTYQGSAPVMIDGKSVCQFSYSFTIVALCIKCEKPLSAEAYDAPSLNDSAKPGSRHALCPQCGEVDKDTEVQIIVVDTTGKRVPLPALFSEAKPVLEVLDDVFHMKTGQAVLIYFMPDLWPHLGDPRVLAAIQRFKDQRVADSSVGKMAVIVVPRIDMLPEAFLPMFDVHMDTGLTEKQAREHLTGVFDMFRLAVVPEDVDAIVKQSTGLVTSEVDRMIANAIVEQRKRPRVDGKRILSVDGMDAWREARAGRRSSERSGDRRSF